MKGIFCHHNWASPQLSASHNAQDAQRAEARIGSGERFFRFFLSRARFVSHVAKVRRRISSGRAHFFEKHTLESVNKEDPLL